MMQASTVYAFKQNKKRRYRTATNTTVAKRSRIFADQEQKMIQKITKHFQNMHKTFNGLRPRKYRTTKEEFSNGATMFVPQKTPPIDGTNGDMLFCVDRYMENIGITCSEDWEQLPRGHFNIMVPLPWNSDFHNIM